MEHNLEIGSVVVYIDPTRGRHNALVTNVFGPQCCNVLWVSGDDSKQDPYGRQIERQSSCCHTSMNQAKANCWCWPDEVE